MKSTLRYIEQKSGFSDNGPAWIGLVSFSKTGTTVYFNGKAFKRGQGISGNHYDIETGYEYWISGIKKDMTDRHWAGGGIIYIERRILDEYLLLVDKQNLDPKRYSIVDVETNSPANKIYNLENELHEKDVVGRGTIHKEPNELTVDELREVIEYLKEEEYSVQKKARKSYKDIRKLYEDELEKRLS